MLEHFDARIGRKLQTRRIQMRFPKLATGHHETCEQERARRTDVFDGMQDRVKEADEWVQPQEKSV